MQAFQTFAAVCFTQARRVLSDPRRRDRGAWYRGMWQRGDDGILEYLTASARSQPLPANVANFFSREHLSSCSARPPAHPPYRRHILARPRVLRLLGGRCRRQCMHCGEESPCCRCNRTTRGYTRAYKKRHCRDHEELGQQKAACWRGYGVL